MNLNEAIEKLSGLVSKFNADTTTETKNIQRMTVLYGGAWTITMNEKDALEWTISIILPGISILLLMISPLTTLFRGAMLLLHHLRIKSRIGNKDIQDQTEYSQRNILMEENPCTA